MFKHDTVIIPDINKVAAIHSYSRVDDYIICIYIGSQILRVCYENLSEADALYNALTSALEWDTQNHV